MAVTTLTLYLNPFVIVALSDLPIGSYLYRPGSPFSSYIASPVDTFLQQFCVICNVEMGLEDGVV